MKDRTFSCVINDEIYIGPSGKFDNLKHERDRGSKTVLNLNVKREFTKTQQQWLFNSMVREWA